MTNFGAITSKKASLKGPIHDTVKKGDRAYQVHATSSTRLLRDVQRAR